MTVSALCRVWEESKQTGAHLLALMFIADNADSFSGEAFVTVETLAARARVDPLDVIHVINDLVNSGDVVDVASMASILTGSDPGYAITISSQYRSAELRRDPAYDVNKRQVTRIVAARVFQRDAFRCRYCGSCIDLSIDHIVPQKNGRDDSIENLVTCCRSCNSRKGARTPEQAGMVLLDMEAQGGG
jgi:hypothetical protein